MGGRLGILCGSFIVAAGCTDEPGPPDLPPMHTCAAAATARVDLAPPGGDYGDIEEGGPLWCGNPPQGGAPYTPFRLRLLGPEGLEDGVTLEMVAADTETGEELAYTTLVMGVTCANVGDSEGFWVGSEAHMRYTGWELDDLDGRTAEITVTATGVADPSVRIVRQHEVLLVLERD
jgi:hypothetical protein